MTGDGGGRATVSLPIAQQEPEDFDTLFEDCDTFFEHLLTSPQIELVFGLSILFTNVGFQMRLLLKYLHCSFSHLHFIF